MTTKRLLRFLGSCQQNLGWPEQTGYNVPLMTGVTNRKEEIWSHFSSEAFQHASREQFNSTWVCLPQESQNWLIHVVISGSCLLIVCRLTEYSNLFLSSKHESCVLEAVVRFPDPWNMFPWGGYLEGSKNELPGRTPRKDNWLLPVCSLIFNSHLQL